jgi:hypothetical protein
MLEALETRLAELADVPPRFSVDRTADGRLHVSEAIRVQGLLQCMGQQLAHPDADQPWQVRTYFDS